MAVTYERVGLNFDWRKYVPPISPPVLNRLNRLIQIQISSQVDDQSKGLVSTFAAQGNKTDKMSHESQRMPVVSVVGPSRELSSDEHHVCCVSHANLWDTVVQGTTDCETYLTAASEHVTVEEVDMRKGLAIAQFICAQF
jgi:hypothetical protein